MQQEKTKVYVRPVESRAKRITHNTLFLYGSEATARLFSWALLAFLTRRWTAVGTYGQYALVVNWISILGIFSELGLNALVVREVAHRRDQALFYLRNAIAIRSAFSLVFWALLIGISFLLHYEPVLKVAMAVMGLRILLDGMGGGYAYLFQAHERMAYSSLVNILGSAVRLVGIVAVVEMGGGVVAACAIWTLASAVAFVALAIKGWSYGWRVDLSSLRFNEFFSTLRLSVPFATFGAFQMLYYRVDSILLKSLAGNDAVGYYDLASKVLFVTLAFSQIFVMAVFPAVSAVRDDAQVFSRLTEKTFKFLLALGVPASVGGWFLAKPIVLLISGPKYLPAVPMFKVLMLSAAPYFLSHVYAFTLGIYNTLRLNLQFAGLFLLNVALNLALIPRLGGEGAAWATVICEVAGLVLGFGLAASYLRNIHWYSIMRPFIACMGAAALMGAGIQLDPRLYWLALGPVSYALMFWLLGGLEPKDLESLKAVFRVRGS